MSRIEDDLEVDAGIGRFAQSTSALPRTSMCLTTAASPIFGQFLHLGTLGGRHRRRIGGHRGQEGLAEMVGQGTGQLGHVVAGLGRLGHADQRPARVTLGQGVGQTGQHDQFVIDGATGRHLIQSGKGVAC